MLRKREYTPDDSVQVNNAKAFRISASLNVNYSNEKEDKRCATYIVHCLQGREEMEEVNCTVAWSKPLPLSPEDQTHSFGSGYLKSLRFASFN